MPPVIRIIGRSGAGKTTMLVELVRLLAGEGTRVAVMKHAHHTVDLDRQGKDSFRFAAAGASAVTVVSREKHASFRAILGNEPSLNDLVVEVGCGVDVVLAEGFHDAETPYFLLLDSGGKSQTRRVRGELLGVIAAEEGDGRTLHRSDAGAVATAIRKWLSSTADAHALEHELAQARAFHGHMCPGQLLGVRLAMLGCRAVDVPVPRASKNLVTWVEIDRCGADAVQSVTGCKLGKRTLKYIDNGKLAATFLNTETGVAVRVVARADSRERAAAMYPALERHDAQLRAYRELPNGELFDVQQVEVGISELDQPGKPVMRVRCVICGEEVNDGRHVGGDDGPVCRSCTGAAYYRPVSSPESQVPR